MKKQLLIILLTLVSLASIGQVKISDMAPYTGNVDSAYFPSVVNNTNRKIFGADIQKRRLDSITDALAQAVSDITNKVSQTTLNDTAEALRSAIGSGSSFDSTSLSDRIDLKADASDLTAHTSNTSNPHSVTLAQVGYDSATDHAQQNAAIGDKIPTSKILLDTGFQALLAKNNIAAWGNSLTEGYPAYPFPAQLSILSGRYVYNGGVSGETSTQIKNRMIADTAKFSWPTIIWAGRNNYSDSTSVVNDIAQMIDSLGHDNYLVLGIINGEFAAEYKDGASYSKIININSYLSATYGERFVPIREYLVSLYDAGIAQDVTDHDHDIVPSSLRASGDNVHLNKSGYDTVAKYIYDNYMSYLTASSDKLIEADKAVALVNGDNAGSFRDYFSVNSDSRGAFAVDATSQKTTFYKDTAFASLGSNLVANGDFSGGLTSWTATGWTDGTGKATHTAGNTNALSQSVSLVISRMYEVSVAITGRTAGSILVALGGVEISSKSATVTSNSITTSTSASIFWGSSAGSYTFSITPTSDFDGSVSAISIKQVPAYPNTLDFFGAGVNGNFKTAGDNVGFGRDNLYYLQSSASQNTAFGSEAMRRVTIGVSNTSIGYWSNYALTNGTFNTALGTNSLRDNSDGSSNTAVGSSALERVSRGIQNTALGRNALIYAATTSSGNTAIGYVAGQGAVNMVVNNNTIVGSNAGLNIANGGNNNVIIGWSAGQNVNAGDKNIVLGHNISLPTAGGSNQLNIGNIIFGTGVSGTGTTIAGNIGVGTNAPASKLEVAGSFATPVTDKTAAYTATINDYTLTTDATTAAFTITLPTAVGITGRIYTIKKIDASANAVTVDGNGSQTIDGATTYSLSAQWKYVTIQSDGTNWIIIGNN